MRKFVKDSNFHFIKERIYRLHNAIMYSMSNELIKIPNSVIHVLRIDESGHLWFRCNVSSQYVHEYEDHFPVRLHFFRKGFDYFVEVSGAAVIVKDKMDDYLKKEEGTEKQLLLKMDINCVEYVEPHVKKKSMAEQLIESSYRWLQRLIAVPNSIKTFARQ